MSRLYKCPASRFSSRPKSAINKSSIDSANNKDKNKKSKKDRPSSGKPGVTEENQSASGKRNLFSGSMKKSG